MENDGYAVLRAKDGVEIFYKVVLPDRLKAILIISHGYGGHSGQYDHVVSFFSERGYGVLSYDHRGHGRSPTKRGHLGQYESLIEDMHQVVSMVRNRLPGLPVFTVGHSMGGFVAFAYGIQYPETLAGQIFSAPALGMPWGTGWIPEPLFEALGTGFNKIRVYHLIKRRAARDQRFRRDLRNDPLTLKYATVGFFYEFIHKGIRGVQHHIEEYTLPCLFLHGRGDKIIPYAYSLKAMERIASSDKTLKLYDGLYHELLQEPEQQIIMQDMLAWLER